MLWMRGAGHIEGQLALQYPEGSAERQRLSGWRHEHMSVLMFRHTLQANSIDCSLPRYGALTQQVDTSPCVCEHATRARGTQRLCYCCSPDGAHAFPYHSLPAGAHSVLLILLTGWGTLPSPPSQPHQLGHTVSCDCFFLPPWFLAARELQLLVFIWAFGYFLISGLYI